MESAGFQATVAAGRFWIGMGRDRVISHQTDAIVAPPCHRKAFADRGFALFCAAFRSRPDLAQLLLNSSD
jgi:hypothetical protein